MRYLPTFSPHNIGVDDPQLDDAILNCHSSATPQILGRYLKENELARHYIILAASPSSNIIAHEAHFTLLDRPLSHGAIVKRSAKDLQSGTVVNIGGDYDIAHSFSTIENDESPCDPQKVIRNIEAGDLEYSREWEVGDYVIWNNCWLGEVAELVEAITICLSNNTVVTIDTPGQLKLRKTNIPNQHLPDSPAQNNPSRRQRPAALNPFSLLEPSPINFGEALDAEEPSDFEVGNIVETTKGNIRRGVWRYGAYDPNIEPVGKVVEVRVTSICIDWICQNMMVRSRFVPIEPPEPWVDHDAETWLQLRKFHRLSDGGNGLNATDLEQYDRVRFRDIDDAITKYNAPIRTEYGHGKIEKIPRSSTLGYDVNVFMILARRSWVTVQWQDLSVTRERSIDLIRCDNSDEHELWPGDLVITKLEAGSRTQFLPPSNQLPSTRTLSGPMPSTFEGPDEPLVFVSPEKIGVIQSVDASRRIARVCWFHSPKIELAGEMIIPGSITGILDGGTPDEVSMYEVAAHPALSICRGDFVLVAPEHRGDNQGGEGTSFLREHRVANIPPDPSMAAQVTSQSSGQTSSLGTIGDALRGIVDTGLIANLSASLINTTNPQLHTLSRMLHQFPSGLRGDFGPQQNLPSTPLTHAPPDWFGEVVDKGLDGLVTVRLGALEEVRNIKVPIERLTIVFDGDDFDDDDDYSGPIDFMSGDGSDSESESDYSMEADDWISEQIFYEGGEPMETGNEADWLTDEENEGDIDEMEIENLVGVPTEIADDDNILKEDIKSNLENLSAYGTETAHRSTEKHVDGSEKASSKLSRAAKFSILDSPVPSAHAFAGMPATEQSVHFLRRVNKEHKILQTSLPEGIFVRTWESRLDLLRVLILGPRNTPYELAPFVFDFHLGSNFPSVPPTGFFHSWTKGIGRVNPNLYEDGKICLSLLGTWHGEKKTENWSSSGSSLLQVLVSLMGLVLVKEPYYNEAGFNVYVGAEEATVNSALYSERAFILSRGFVKHVLQQPVQGLEDILVWLYDPKLKGGMHLLGEVLERGKEVVRASEDNESSSSSASLSSTSIDGIPKLTAGAIVLLKKTLQSLEEILSRDL